MSEKQISELELKAWSFASQAHEGQERKYSGEKYITHPAAVVEIVRSVPHDDAMLCAAWLHDVVEDCGVELEDINREFGSDVTELVEMLTDISKPQHGKRAIRKEIDRQHTALANPRAKTIKLADLIDNGKDIIKQDPSFAKVYLAEKRLLLEVLTEGDPTLYKQAHQIAHLTP